MRESVSRPRVCTLVLHIPTLAVTPTRPAWKAQAAAMVNRWPRPCDTRMAARGIHSICAHYLQEFHRNEVSMEYHIDPETLIPTAPLPRLRQAERRIEQLEAAKRDLELQRDELLRLIEKACAFLRSGHADAAKDIFDSSLAYCEEFTPAERAE